MFFGHAGLKIGGRDLVGSALTRAPFHEQTNGQPAKHAQDPHAIVALDPAAIVVVGHIQTLVEAAFDAPALAVQVQPLTRGQPFDRGAGEQGYFFVLAAGGLAQQPRPLRGEREANLLRTD